MAVSDPSPEVPTATGTLSGVAQFVWSGTAWVAATAASGGSVPTGPAGTPNAAVVSVQGISGGTGIPITSLAEGAVADAAWTTGSGSMVALLKAVVGALNAALPAGTNQLGLVTAGGFTALQQATPTVQAAAYAAGAVIGGLITFSTAARTSGGSGIIQSVAASFISGVVPSLDVVFFNANPTGSTLTDKNAAAVATADLGKVIGVAHLSDSTLLGATTPSYVQALQLALPFGAISGTTIYAAVVTRTAVTLGSTSDMILSARILQD